MTPYFREQMDLPADEPQASVISNKTLAGGVICIDERIRWAGVSFNRVTFAFAEVKSDWGILFVGCHFDRCDGLPKQILAISHNCVFVDSVYEAAGLPVGTNNGNFIDNSGDRRAVHLGYGIHVASVEPPAMPAQQPVAAAVEAAFDGKPAPRSILIAPNCVTLSKARFSLEQVQAAVALAHSLAAQGGQSNG